MPRRQEHIAVRVGSWTARSTPLLHEHHHHFTNTTTRFKYRNVVANPASAISVTDPEQPYR
jgi:hypothetical protein